jgi:hypothetical protein
LIKKVESNIAYLEEKDVSASEELSRTLTLSEDCVESAHQSLQCIIAGADLGIIGYSWLDLFFVFHSVLIVCADFLARPKGYQDTAKDIERKEVVRVMLNHVRGMKLALTYKTLGRIAMQFASITGVVVEQTSPENIMAGQEGGDQIDEQEAALGGGETAHILAEISDVREDWFANATSSLGLDFFELHESQGALPLQAGQPSYPELYGAQTSNSEVDDWTAQTLRGMHTL